MARVQIVLTVCLSSKAENSFLVLFIQKEFILMSVSAFHILTL